MDDVIKKLRFKAPAVVIAAPPQFQKEFITRGFLFDLPKDAKSTNTLVFINDSKEYKKFLQNDLKKIEPDSLLWFAYPKGTSKIKTDVNRDSIMAIGEEYGITTVTAISIDETWSALRFRPIEKVGT